ncbi:MAG: hypothetical protein Q4P32_10785 [Micrococcales bacterium]|nr:hypothetical protein [Micrococcales bacterium]
MMKKHHALTRVGVITAVACLVTSTAAMSAVAGPMSAPDQAVAPVSTAPTAGQDAAAAAVSSVRGGEQAVTTTTREERYWTQARMSAATSADELPPQRATTAVPSAAQPKKATVVAKPAVPSRAVTAHARGATASMAAKKGPVRVPTTAGKLFFTYGGSDYVCSASSVNSRSKSLIMTAGHCVHSGPHAGWHRNFAYAPAYYNGRAPYGIWTWQRALTFRGWADSGRFDYDQAFIAVNPKNGVRLVNRVGGNGLVVGASNLQKSVRVFGWPAERPFTGGIPYYCDGRTGKRSGSIDATLGCAMNGGASGGPWLINRVNDTVGYVFAITSRRTLSGPPTLLAAPNSLAVKNLYQSIG